MIFREGLLEARGQIVFILALTISTAVIIYLEALDTEDRIRGRIEEALVGGGAAAPPRPPSRIAPVRPCAGPRRPSRRTRPPRRPARRSSRPWPARCSSERSAPARQRPRAEAVLAAVEADRRRAAAGPRRRPRAAAAAFPDLQERIARLPRA